MAQMHSLKSELYYEFCSKSGMAFCGVFIRPKYI